MPYLDAKPCPFCGSDRIENLGQKVHCWKCSAEGPFVNSYEDAEYQARLVKEKWNNRPQFDAQLTENNGLIEAREAA